MNDEEGLQRWEEGRDGGDSRRRTAGFRDGKPTREPLTGVRTLQPTDRAAWAGLRAALWPEATPEEHTREMDEILRNPERDVVFVHPGVGRRLLGFVEVSLRRYAEGCDTSPVGYLEGLYVAPGARRQGIGRALVAAAEAWARAKGCSEMASDAQTGNQTSQEVHARLGYAEVERLVCFRKAL